MKGGRERHTPSHPAVLTEDPRLGAGAKGVASAQGPGSRGHQSWVPTPRPKALMEDKFGPTLLGRSGSAPDRHPTPHCSPPAPPSPVDPLSCPGWVILWSLAEPRASGGHQGPQQDRVEMAPPRGLEYRDGQEGNPVPAPSSLPRGEGVCKGVNITVHPTGLHGQYQGARE